jgi:phage protein U
MYFKFGDIQFEGLFAAEAFEHSEKASYAEHALIDSKPRLQRTGEQLQEIKLKVHLHRDFGNVEDRVNKFRDARAAGTVLPLIFGNGNIDYRYVITDVDKSFTQLDSYGNIIECTLDITFKEFAGGIQADLIAQQGAANDRAFALTKIAPLPIASVTKVDSPALVVNVALADVGGGVQKMKTNLDKMKAGLTDLQKGGQKVIAAVNDAKQKLDKAQAKINQVAALAQAAQQLPAKITAMKGHLDNLAALMPPTNFNAVGSAFGNVQVGMSDLTSAGAPISALQAIRMPV